MIGTPQLINDLLLVSWIINQYLRVQYIAKIHQNCWKHNDNSLINVRACILQYLKTLFFVKDTNDKLKKAYLIYSVIRNGDRPGIPSFISKKWLKWHFRRIKVTTNFLNVTQKLTFTINSSLCALKTLITAQPDSCHFCFNDGKWLAGFSGSQRTGNHGKRIAKIFLPIGFPGY